ncbi:MAG TPA: gamma-glutamyltransferase, partial [Gemmatimonadales bacterium]|nr:gamma-glutamyltransferase [Gemmatimonadales bacterium]
MPAPVVAALLFLGAQLQPTAPILRDPAYAPDGRMVVSIDGDLWVQKAAGRTSAWTQLTSGAAWDRQPAWSPDGGSIVFVSDRAEGTALWRLRVRDGEALGAPERLTRGPSDALEPSVRGDGVVLFVRGRGAAARLYLRDTDGRERRLTSGALPERSGVMSPDGRRVAYVQQGPTGARLRVRAMDSSAVDSVVVSDRAIERPAWSPDGERLAFSSPAPRAGVYVTTPDGRYVNVVAFQSGAVAWSPDGGTIAVAPPPDESPGYNGDPSRVGDREVAEALGSDVRLLFVDAPLPPGAGTATAAAPALDRAARNAAAFDRAWARVDTAYARSADPRARRETWARLRARHRPLALAAADDPALERALHAMLRERPPLGTEASGRAAVSSAHPVATAAGVEILRRGGNAVDAAVAVSFALGVVEPDASGIGGYGEMLIQLQGMARPTLIDFMARAPEEASLSNAALLRDGRYPTDGPVLAMVPGTVAGMHAAWKRHGSGRVPWAELLAPAIHAARNGFVVSDGLATTLRVERDGLAKYDASRALFFREGEPLAAGDTLRNPDLAATLERIASGGADGFYRGETARRIASDLRGQGNAVQLADLARYFAPEREPVHFTYR